MAQSNRTNMKWLTSFVVFGQRVIWFRPTVTSQKCRCYYVRTTNNCYLFANGILSLKSNMIISCCSTIYVGVTNIFFLVPHAHTSNSLILLLIFTFDGTCSIFLSNKRITHSPLGRIECLSDLTCEENVADDWSGIEKHKHRECGASDTSRYSCETRHVFVQTNSLHVWARLTVEKYLWPESNRFVREYTQKSEYGENLSKDDNNISTIYS